MSLILLFRSLLLTFGLLWFLSIVTCYILLWILDRSAFDWKGMARYSAPYRPKTIIHVSAWIPFVNTWLVFDLWKLYKLQKQVEREDEITKFEQYRRRM